MFGTSLGIGDFTTYKSRILTLLGVGQSFMPQKNAFAFVGDSRLSGMFNDSPTNLVKTNMWFNTANALIGQKMRIAYNGAVSGLRSDQYLAIQSGQTTTPLQQAIASGAGWLVIHGVVNDIAQSGTTGDTAATIWTRILNASTTALNAGMNIILVTDPGSNALAAGSVQGMVYQFNEYAREYAAKTSGVMLFDLAAAVMDPTATGNPNFISGYSSDGTHLNSFGHWYAGHAFASFIDPFVPPLPSQIYSIDEISSNANIQQVANPLFLTTTGGTTSTGFTGSTPASWRSLCTGSATATISTVTAPDGIGNAVKFVGTFTAAGEVIRLDQSTTLGNITSPGDIVDAGGKVIVEAGSVNLAATQFHFNLSTTANPVADLFPIGTNIALPNVAMNLTMRSMPYTVPGSLSFINSQQRFIAAGAGSFTAYMYGFWIRRRIAV